MTSGFCGTSWELVDLLASYVDGELLKLSFMCAAFLTATYKIEAPVELDATQYRNAIDHLGVEDIHKGTVKDRSPESKAIFDKLPSLGRELSKKGFWLKTLSIRSNTPKLRKLERTKEFLLSIENQDGVIDRDLVSESYLELVERCGDVFE